jgi:hypothetical protein
VGRLPINVKTSHTCEDLPYMGRLPLYGKSSRTWEDFPNGSLSPSFSESLALSISCHQPPSTSSRKAPREMATRCSRNPQARHSAPDLKGTSSRKRTDAHPTVRHPPPAQGGWPKGGIDRDQYFSGATAAATVIGPPPLTNLASDKK